MTEVTLELRSKFKSVQILVCDVDGVLTDGSLTYSDGGEATKSFHVRDGMGLRLLMDNDIHVAIITARSGAAVSKRMSDLGIKHVAQGRGDKGEALREVLESTGIDPAHCAYIGDDIIDLPAIRIAGLGVTVADGHEAVRAEADFVTTRGGGRGAVRELCDAIVDAKIGLRAAIDVVLNKV